MKQLIILMAVLPLMLIFIVQYAFEQQKNTSIGQLQDYIYTAKEQAKQDGYFTSENILSLKRKIAGTFKITEGQVLFEGTTVPRYRVNQFNERELIHYKVSVPIVKLMAGASFFGISDEENQAMYIIENYTASERLAD
jgi:hypothetical protein